MIFRKPKNGILPKLFIIPTGYTRHQDGQLRRGVTLNDIKAEAMKLLKDPATDFLDVDQVLQKSLNRCSGVEVEVEVEGGGGGGGGSRSKNNVESTLLMVMKNRIKQVFYLE